MLCVCVCVCVCAHACVYVMYICWCALPRTFCSQCCSDVEKDLVESVCIFPVSFFHLVESVCIFPVSLFHCACGFVYLLPTGWFIIPFPLLTTALVKCFVWISGWIWIKGKERGIKAYSVYVLKIGKLLWVLFSFIKRLQRFCKQLQNFWGFYKCFWTRTQCHPDEMRRWSEVMP